MAILAQAMDGGQSRVAVPVSNPTNPATTAPASTAANATPTTPTAGAAGGISSNTQATQSDGYSANPETNIGNFVRNATATPIWDSGSPPAKIGFPAGPPAPSGIISGAQGLPPNGMSTVTGLTAQAPAPEGTIDPATGKPYLIVEPGANQSSAAQTAALNPNSYQAPQAAPVAGPGSGSAAAGSVYDNIQKWTDPNNPLVAQAAAIGRMGAAMSGFNSGNDSMSQTGAQNAVLGQAMQGATTDANNQTQTNISNSQQVTQASIAGSQEQTQVAMQNAQDATALTGQRMNADANIAVSNTAAENQQLMAKLEGNIQGQLQQMVTAGNLKINNSQQSMSLYNSALQQLVGISTSALDPASKTAVSNSIIQSLQNGIKTANTINGVPGLSDLLDFSTSVPAPAPTQVPAPAPAPDQGRASAPAP
jgi:hypothetical protein